jgi:hypothetical protein
VSFYFYSLVDFTLSLGYNSHQASVVAFMILVENCLCPSFVGRLAGRVVQFHKYCCPFGCEFLSFEMCMPNRNYSTAIAFGLSKDSMISTVWVCILG